MLKKVFSGEALIEDESACPDVNMLWVINVFYLLGSLVKNSAPLLRNLLVNFPTGFKSQPKIANLNLPFPDQYIRRFQISMNIVFWMEILYSS